MKVCVCVCVGVCVWGGGGGGGRELPNMWGFFAELPAKSS